MSMKTASCKPRERLDQSFHPGLRGTRDRPPPEQGGTMDFCCLSLSPSLGCFVAAPCKLLLWAWVAGADMLSCVPPPLPSACVFITFGDGTKSPWPLNRTCLCGPSNLLGTL